MSTNPKNSGLLLAGVVLLPLAWCGSASAQSVGTAPPSGSVSDRTQRPSGGEGQTQTADGVSTDATVGDQSGLSDIIVTGTKLGTQNLQKTPAAVSVIDSKLLDQQGLNTLQDAAAYVPNVTFQRFGTSAGVYIRGIGSNSTNAGSDSSVTQQVDGVYIARPTAQTGDFLDVERIEVLRGPQGTLYGRNAVGGTFNIISRQPSNTFGGQVRVGYGAYNEVTAEGFVTGPIVADQLSASLSATYRDHDAYFQNIVPGVPSLGAAHRFGTRAQLRWAPTAAFDVTLRGDYSLIRDIAENYDQLLRPVAFAPLASSLVGSYRQNAVDGSQNANVDSGGVSLDANYRFGNGFAVKSITAWRKLKSSSNNDNDATEIPVQFLNQTERQRQFSQEFNLNYQAQRLRGVVGLYYFGDQDNQVNFGPVPPSVATPAARSALLNAQASVRTRSYAAFAQGSYEILPHLDLILGARYTTETKDFDQNFARTSLNPATLGISAPGFPILFGIGRTDKAFTPKFGIDYQVTPDVFLYGSVTRGFKSGGFNNAATSAATAGFNPEKIWAYEAGIKTQFFDRRVRVNLTAFDYDYSDLQVRQFISVGNAVISNAASAKVKGVELETLFRPASDVQLSGNVAYLDAHYGSFTAAPIASAYGYLFPTGAISFDASGNRIENSPQWSGIAAIDYTPKVGNYRFTAHLDYALRGKVFFDPSNVAIASQGPVGLFNANISVGPERGVRIEAFVKNLTDKKYFVLIAGNGLVPAGLSADPRTYGVRIGFEF